VKIPSRFIAKRGLAFLLGVAVEGGYLMQHVRWLPHGHSAAGVQIQAQDSVSTSCVPVLGAKPRYCSSVP